MLPPYSNQKLHIKSDTILINAAYPPKITKIVEKRLNKVILSNEQLQEINSICYGIKSNKLSIQDTIMRVHGGKFINLINVDFLI